MNAKHTPAPWEVSKLGNGLHILGDRRPGSAQVVATVGGSSQVNLEANARLIAEAPAMRELLELIAEPNNPFADAASVSPWLRARRAEARALLARIDGSDHA